MGWKGYVRSANAQARRQRLAHERIDRSLNKFTAQADNVAERLDAEVEREIDKVRRWEEKVSADPIKALKLTYANDQWSSAPLEDNAGIVKYSLAYNIVSVPMAVFQPIAVRTPTLTLGPIAIAVSAYFTAIAFEVMPAEGREAGATVRLVNRTTPEDSKLALASPDGNLLLPSDSSIEGKLFAGTRKIGVVTFEPFSEPIEFFDILLDSGDDEAPARIRVTAPTLQTEITKELAAPGIAENFAKGLRQKQAESKAQIETHNQALAQSAAKAKKGGCVVVLAVLGAATFVWAL